MKRRRCRGFVLLMTLALLVLTTSLLTLVGRLSISRSLAAAQMARDLQQKWGLASCRNAVLPNAEEILVRAEANDERHRIKQISATVQLGEQAFALTLCDEQAKANVNASLEHHTPASVEDRLREMYRGTSWVNNVHLRPDLSDESSAATPPATLVAESIHSYGQIFDDCSADQLFSSTSGGALDHITCWGSGAINILRADEPALQLALWPTLSRVQIDRLIDARDALINLSRSEASAAGSTRVGQGTISALLQGAKIDAKLLSQLSLTDHSTCHSLWIVLRDRQRNWYDLTVADDSLEHNPRHENFTW